MKIFVTGAGGQLGRSVVSLLKRDDRHEVYPFSRAELDISDNDSVASTIQSVRPDAVLHCAAYTNVEAAEDTGRDLNWKVNRDASGYVSRAARAVGAKLVYISTDYVFDGTNSEPYDVDDLTNPLNEYGRAKLAGEYEVLRRNPDAYVIRTSWVFEEFGHNFVNTMLRLSGKMDTLEVVNDQYGRPTYAPDLAKFMLYLLEREIPGGLYHFANDGEATWYQFAQSILQGQDVTVLPVDSTEFIQKANRPKYSVLSLEKAKDVGFRIPTWQNALERFKDNMK